jgi:hypothetical protein
MTLQKLPMAVAASLAPTKSSRNKKTIDIVLGHGNISSSKA